MKSELLRKCAVVKFLKNQNRNKKYVVAELIKNQNHNKKCVVVEFLKSQNNNKKYVVAKSLKNQKSLLYMKLFKLKIFIKFVVNKYSECYQ